ncbi:MAG: DegV family protein [Proteocatella sp.]
MPVKIITDSTSYISKDLVEKYDIDILSLNVLLNGKNKRELDWTNEEFYQEIEKCNEFPKSSQPSLEEMTNIFEKHILQNDQVAAVFMSSKMSGTFSTANVIKEQLLEEYKDAQIEILDSKTNSMQLGFAALEGAKKASEGATLKEVVEVMEHVINNSRFLFTPETFEYLKKGGRIGGAAALLGHLLNIKLVLTVENGQTTVFGKARTRKKAIDLILNKLYEDASDRELGGVIVHHINCEEKGQEIAEEIGLKLGIKVKLQSIGPVIGTHVGPGSVGVAYWLK